MTTLLIYIFRVDILLAVQGSEETEIKILKWFAEQAGDDTALENTLCRM